MIIIEKESVVVAAREALLAIMETRPNISDSSILRERSAVIRIKPGGINPVGFYINANTFVYKGDYATYIPEIDTSLVAEEERDYTKLFLANGAIDSLILALRKNNDSRRAVVSSWDSQYLDPKVVGVCITQLYARLRDGKLELHSHARANDAYRLLLLDMQLALCIQQELAERVGVPVGEYIHFIDSLHVYKKYAPQIERQLQYMRENSLWKA